MPIEVRCHTDPACPWSWAAEPKLRRLMWEFDGSLRFRWVMAGVVRRHDPADSLARVGEWLDAAAASAMPLDPRLWIENPISSSYPAGMAAKAASEQGPEAAYRYLRRLREGLVTERRKLDHPDALLALAGPAGLDFDRFRIDLRSNAITEAFAADLDADAARAGELPVLRFGDGPEVGGLEPYERLREAALAAGAGVANEGGLDPRAAVSRFGRLATAEVVELARRPRPLVAAELWRLAAEWKLRPQPVLGGTFWEPA